MHRYELCSELFVGNILYQFIVNYYKHVHVHTKSDFVHNHDVTKANTKIAYMCRQGRTWKKIDGRAPGSGRVQFVINSFNFVQKY